MQVMPSHVMERQFMVCLKGTQQRLGSGEPDLLINGDQISRCQAQLSDDVVLVHLPSTRSDRARLVITSGPAARPSA